MENVMLTRRQVFIGATAAAAMAPVLANMMLDTSAASERDAALRLIAARVKTALSTPVSTNATPDFVRMWEQLTAEWRTAPDLVAMVEQKTNRIFANGYSILVYAHFGSLPSQGMVRDYFSDYALDHFPFHYHELREPEMLAAFTALVPQHLR